MNSMFNKDRFSYSKINTYITCPKKFYLKYCLGIVSKYKSKALAAGFVMSKAIDVYRKTNSEKLGIDEILDTWKTPEADCLDFDITADPMRSIERLIDIFKEYTRKYPDESKIVLQTEVTFQQPITVFGQEIIFDGRIDGCLLNSGSPALIEDKTTSRLGETYFRSKKDDFQILWYLWAAKEMGFFSLGEENTTPKAFINAIYINKSKMKFEREITIKTNKTLNAAQVQMVSWIEDIIRANDNNCWPCNYLHCQDYSGCEYLALRNIDEDSKMWTRMIEGNFKFREIT